MAIHLHFGSLNDGKYLMHGAYPFLNCQRLQIFTLSAKTWQNNMLNAPIFRCPHPFGSSTCSMCDGLV